ncbi:tyrosyl-tRNA synthetase [Metschnikowia bicuspidata var. bicuspidata NRRL YB-4993]|uniref:Tyrosine--tRNA ligase n=1 Tax=Metschnikowia bicuspidata var. bicuspidata NRRL YB-4993 TaxID=869754 RepID=A0A1A0H4P1_9ASCO|nr:tyrosyl-tRNA synthetase [Metschnikowia bicuspidata var. bicuspidata NRRL YB-4993]OBA19044.1 tyrosyl-tRNA synthetase [Metschnikowia bicuspidata var. bicuspidata NRRL YB-4993]
MTITFKSFRFLFNMSCFKNPRIKSVRTVLSCASSMTIVEYLDSVGSSINSLMSIPSVKFQSTGKAPTAESPPDTIAIVPPVHFLTKAEFFHAEYQQSLLGYLQNRNLVESVTSDDLYKLTEPGASKLKLYCGADPTAKSLHLGNLLPLMVLLHFRLRGHDIYGLVGGATGAVGDPSGRTTERSEMENQERIDNVEVIQSQMQRFFENGVLYAQSREIPNTESQSDVGSFNPVNNADWWASIKILDFLATYGKHIRITQMLARDSILSRLSSQQGLGFNEFTYQILQAYDFWHLFKTNGVNVQVGGNDQWGNITAGTDLISRVQKHFSDTTKNSQEKPAYGMTVPLLTTPSGQKFGKSAGNAVFISESMSSPFQLYQFFINCQDEMVEKLLKMFTLLPLDSIENVVMAKHLADPGLRIAQRVLAREVVDLIHGVGVGDEMAYITSFLFPTPDQPFDDEISANKLLLKFKKSGILLQISLLSFKNQHEIKMSTLLSKILGKSKSETKNLIRAGGVYLGIDRDQLDDPNDVVLFDKDNHLIDSKLLLVRAGKQKYYLTEILE